MKISNKFEFDNTIKFVFSLDDKNLIESVIIEQKNTITFCISTQVGCPVGCLFCKSGTFFIRNLSNFEILYQIETLEKYIENDFKKDSDNTLNKKNKKINIVFMGMGEPLLNFDNLIYVINEICINRKNRFSKQKITVSTVGIPDKIIQLGELTKKILPDRNFNISSTVNLAVSLHFIEDEIRKKFIPYANKYSLKNIFHSCQKFQEMSNKRQNIMLEYLLISEINDSNKDIYKMIELINKYKLNVIINLIPYNGKDFLASTLFRSEEIKKIIINNGIKCFLRKPRGLSIDAACGMLASRK